MALSIGCGSCLSPPNSPCCPLIWSSSHSPLYWSLFKCSFSQVRLFSPGPASFCRHSFFSHLLLAERLNFPISYWSLPSSRLLPPYSPYDWSNFPPPPFPLSRWPYPSPTHPSSDWQTPSSLSLTIRLSPLEGREKKGARWAGRRAGVEGQRAGCLAGTRACAQARGRRLSQSGREGRRRMSERVVRGRK